jgi:hypothetical protein
MKKRKRRGVYRHGDLLLVPIAAMPRGKCEVRKDGVLALGEATGHAHRIADLTAAEVYDIGEERFLVVSETGVRLSHEDHGDLHNPATGAAVALPSGTYQILRKREYQPEAIRNVAD